MFWAWVDDDTVGWEVDACSEGGGAADHTEGALTEALWRCWRRWVGGVMEGS